MQRNDIAKINLNEPLLRSNAGEILATDDRQGNRFGALLHRDGQIVDANGYAVTGYFIRPNGDTVINEGTAQGNLVYVDLAPECYAYEGAFSLAIKVNGPSITSTIRVIDGYVRLTKTDRQIAPEGLLPDLEELLGQIAAMENAYTKGAHAMIARLSTPFTVTGETVSCYPVPDYPLDVITHFVPVQEGEGDASPANIRALSPVNRVYLNCGKVAYHERTLNPNVYGGAYHWAEGKITGKAKYKELDGSEGWFLNPNGDTSYFLMYLEEGAFGVDHKAFMSHYKPLDTLAFGVAGTNVFRCWNKDGRFRLAIRPDLSAYATAEDFKDYLAAQKAAGTPVQLVYFLMDGAEEETGYQPEEILSRAGKNQFNSGLNGNTVTVSGPLDPAYQNAMQDERIEALEESAIGGGGGGGSGGSYTLPVATAETLGGVKVGDGLQVEADGRVSVEPEGVLSEEPLVTLAVEETVGQVWIDKDAEGQPLNLKALLVVVNTPAVAETKNGYVRCGVEMGDGLLAGYFPSMISTGTRESKFICLPVYGYWFAASLGTAADGGNNTSVNNYAMKNFKTLTRTTPFMKYINVQISGGVPADTVIKVYGVK
ncbi:MAG: hypothetical protein J6V25_12595 [Oscillospiraceae bacterium]|nr:hypothetical protein [Oscillospiraceae bacterium]